MTLRSLSLLEASLPGGGGVGDDAQVAAGSREDVAVEGECSGIGVVGGFGVCIVNARDAGVPQVCEVGAVVPQVLDQGAQAGIGGVADGRRSEVGDYGRLEAGLLCGGVADPAGEAGEVAPGDIALASALCGGVLRTGRPTGSGSRPRRARQRRTIELVEQSPHPRRDACRQLPGARRRLAREQVRVLALGRRQAQGAGQGGEDLWGGGGGAALFHADDVVHTQPASWASSSRRSPAARRTPPAGSPASAGVVRSRQPRSALPSSLDSLTPRVSGRRARTAWYWQSTGNGGYCLFLRGAMRVEASSSHRLPE